jgi:hypothetical protein
MFSFVKWRRPAYFTVAIPAVQAPDLCYNRRVASLHFNIYTFCLAQYTFQWMGEGGAEVHTGFWWRSLKEGDDLEDQDLDGEIAEIVLKWIFTAWEGEMDWDHLTQGRDRWRSLENEVMNLRDPWFAGNFLASWEPISFSRKSALHWVITHLSWHLNLSFISPLLLPLLISHSSIQFNISFTNYA